MDQAFKFWIRQAIWSQKTFGNDDIRGPIGALKHLQKEINETLAEIRQIESVENKTINLVSSKYPSLLEEFADMQHLIFDACRRAGYTYKDLIDMCFIKLSFNEKREWNESKEDEPVEHKR